MAERAVSHRDKSVPYLRLAAGGFSWKKRGGGSAYFRDLYEASERAVMIWVGMLDRRVGWIEKNGCSLSSLERGTLQCRVGLK